MWKEIKGFENYLVNENGEIKSKKKNKLLKPTKKSHGYCEVTLYQDGKPHYKRVHRLVAQTFIENPHNYPVVNHIDGDKTNNHVSNLEWCTVSENTYHATHVLHTNDWETGVEMTKVKTFILDTNTGEVLEFASRKECECYYGAEFRSIVGSRQCKRFKHLRLVGDASATDKLENQ